MTPNLQCPACDGLMGLILGCGLRNAIDNLSCVKLIMISKLKLESLYMVDKAKACVEWVNFIIDVASHLKMEMSLVE